MDAPLRKNTYWHIFFDDGGVLNNNEIRGAQWKKIIPQFFIPRFGGTEEIWSKAYYRVIEELMNEITRRWETQDRPEDFNEYWETIILPSQAIVVDDNPYFLEYAREAGSHVIQSHINGKKRKVAEYMVYNFRELPNFSSFPRFPARNA